VRAVAPPGRRLLGCRGTLCRRARSLLPPGSRSAVLVLQHKLARADLSHCFRRLGSRDCRLEEAERNQCDQDRSHQNASHRPVLPLQLRKPLFRRHVSPFRGSPGSTLQKKEGAPPDHAYSEGLPHPARRAQCKTTLPEGVRPAPVRPTSFTRPVGAGVVGFRVVAQVCNADSVVSVGASPARCPLSVQYQGVPALQHNRSMLHGEWQVNASRTNCPEERQNPARYADEPSQG
jgi:hypothetical protein